VPVPCRCWLLGGANLNLKFDELNRIDEAGSCLKLSCSGAVFAFVSSIFSEQIRYRHRLQCVPTHDRIYPSRRKPASDDAAARAPSSLSRRSFPVGSDLGASLRVAIQDE
jgi:hypothetical protein